MKLRRLENEPDASGNTTENPLDTWLMKVRLERLEYDLGQSATKAERWKQAAEEAAHQNETLQAEAKELRALLERSRQARPLAGEKPKELSAQNELMRQLSLQVAHRNATIARLREDLETQRAMRHADLSEAQDVQAAAEAQADALRDELSARTAEKEALSEELGTLRKETQAKADALRDELSARTAEKEALSEEIDALRTAQDERLQDLAALGKELESQGKRLVHERERRQNETAALGNFLGQTRQQISEAQAAVKQKSDELHHEHQKRHILEALAITKGEINAALMAPFFIRRHQRVHNKLKEDVRLISASGLFEADWYVQCYPDVAQAKGGPLRHFVRYGAYELRDPGPEFDSLKYHLANPDVTAHGMAALMHYVRSGKSEGRQVFRVEQP
jgi:chromosome segregation ATPase